MEGIEEADTERASQSRVTRVSQACQRCRGLKTRCLPSGQPGTCKRCFIAGQDCILAEIPRKPRRPRGPSRIHQVEQKLDGLVASIVGAEASRTSITPINDVRTTTSGASCLNYSVSPGSWLPFPTSFEQRPEGTRENVEAAQPSSATTPQFVQELREIHNFADDDDPDRTGDNILQGAQKTESGLGNETIDYLLANGKANELLDEYRYMCTSFPFVPVSAQVSAKDLHQSEPMLFLAIITVASWKSRLQQRKLDRIYRTELASRTIVTPQRSLSLLQSILVYLSRYHFLFSHKTQQIYSLQQLAIGLALDMGLHQRSRRSMMPGQQPSIPQSPQQLLERQRTFLGCYYMSSMIAASLQRPNLLSYSDYMTECSRNLKQACEYPSDSILERLVGLRRLDDQIIESFYGEDTYELGVMDPRILMTFRFVQTQLDFPRQEEDCSPEQKQFMDLSSSFTRMQLNAIALRSSATTAQLPPQDSTQLNALVATLEACKQYLQVLLNIPTAEYHLFSFAEWMKLPSVLITLARLCIPNESLAAAQWDAKAAHERARLDLYLDSLCYRVQGVSTSQYDFWHIMKTIMERLREWFLRKINPKARTSTQVVSPSTVNSSKSEVDALGTAPGDARCPFVATGSNIDVGNGHEDSLFSFMNAPDFDMNLFFDLGLWSDDAYKDMGFGNVMS